MPRPPVLGDFRKMLAESAFKCGAHRLVKASIKIEEKKVRVDRLAE